MDTKSLAKSKRAHSQHHSKKHHPKTPNLRGFSTASVGPSNSKKPPGNEIKEKPRQFRGANALPSNWDRYEEEFDSAVEDSSQDYANQPTDFVMPKSKGADYAYLISEANSEYQTRSSSEFCSSLDDVADDIGQGMGTYLSVRGQSILSWIESDNFVVEDKETASNEASFLLLDLHALAEQLAKIDLSKRLFVEADLLPEELFTEDLQASRNSRQDQAALGSEMYEKVTDELSANSLSFGSSETAITKRLANGLRDDQLKSMNQVEDEAQQFSRTDQSTVLKLVESNLSTNTEAKPSGFEATAAEAELDMLLGSFSETNFFESHCSEEKPKYLSALPSKRAPDLSRSAFSIGLDDTLDNLLKETSSLSLNVASQSEVKATPSDYWPALPLPTSKAEVRDDFDSWLDTI